MKNHLLNKDEKKKKEEEVNKLARQMLIRKLGMGIGKIGRRKRP